MDILNFTKVYCSQVDNSSAKLGFFMSKDLHESLSKYCHNHGIILKEAVPSYLQGFSLIRNHFLFHLMEETTLDLTAAGIVQKIHTDFFKKSPVFEVKKEPKVLTISSLAFCFQVWLITCAFSIFTFFTEILVFYVSKLFRKTLWLIAMRVLIKRQIY